MLSGKNKKAKCGRTIPIEFDCNQKDWNCNKCYEIMDFCYDIKIRDLKEAEAELMMLPKKIENLKKDKEQYKAETFLVRKYLEKQ